MSGPAPTGTGVRLLLVDTYDGVASPGEVLGTTADTGQPRDGLDVEGRVGMDNGALRMKPLGVPGWGRESVAYGPFERRPGLVAGVQVLNGHHASQTFYRPETTRQRARRWVSSLLRRRSPVRPRHHENLAVGLFGSTSPRNPLADGHGLVVHASTIDNGELWAAVRGRPLTAVRGLMNLPLVVVVVLREEGALYLAATVDGDGDLPTLPLLRPLAVDPRPLEGDVHLGVHQRILGEVGYRVDTRVYRSEVAEVPAWATWCTTATSADRFRGRGPLTGRVAERGGGWRPVEGGDLSLDSTGLTGRGWAVLAPGPPVGLVHLLLTPGSAKAGFCLTLDDGPGGVLVVELGADRARVLLERDGAAETLAERVGRRVLRRGREQSVQVLRSDDEVSVHVDGREVVTHRLDRSSPATAGGPATTGVGVRLQGGVTVRDLEAHPRTVDAPVLTDPGWPVLPGAGEVLVDEVFDGAPGPLDGRAVPGLPVVWERLEGDGVVDVVGGGAGAAVRASPEAPNPGRTLYGFDWPDHEYVDLSLTMTPPGTARGQKHNCRAGFVLWQDAENYLVINVWLDDWLEGTSVSTFYRVDGHEDMYDAVWTLTGHSVSWGRRFTLRATFDGKRFTAYVDERPVLYRAVRDVYPHAPRLRVEKLALIANEEWGDDTGTVFHRLVASPRGNR